MTSKLICLFLLFALARGFQQREYKSTIAPFPSSTTPQVQTNGRLNSGSLLNKDRILSPAAAGDKNPEDNGLIEVKEEDIPEGSEVYVLEEPIDQPSEEGEILKTANNIVFRPLFRYRSKQEAMRRNSNRVRRRYYVPRRTYRSPYYYYYPYRYY